MAVGDLNTAVSCTAPSCGILIELSMTRLLKSQQTRQGAGAALEVGAKSPTGNEDQKTGRAGSKFGLTGELKFDWVN